MDDRTIREFRDSVRDELVSNILPFWAGRTPDEAHGGFLGRVSNDGVPEPGAPKGLIVNARILWTFSAAARFAPDPAWNAVADRAAAELLGRFWDPEYGGAYWMLDFQGRPLDVKKKIYGQAFLAYALAEHYQAFGDERSLTRAFETFGLIERHAYDAGHSGYFETYERDWKLAADLRLSEKDLNEKKSMNTHLHVMEAYANLVRARRDARAEDRLEKLVTAFRDRIVHPRTAHLVCFFDEAWTPRSGLVSYGHDIEASWLLCEAAETLGRAALVSDMRALALRMAEAVYRDGRAPDGSLLYEQDPPHPVDTDRHFWVQAEAVVGFLNAYELSGEERYFDAALGAWRYIRDRLIDRRHGDWWYRVSERGEPYLEVPKVSEWKCPYHSGRMCLEAFRRLDRMLAGRTAAA